MPVALNQPICLFSGWLDVYAKEDTTLRRASAGASHPELACWIVYDNSGEEPMLLDWSDKP